MNKKHKRPIAIRIIQHAARAPVMFLGMIKGTIKPVECAVHQYINVSALEILRRDGYRDAADYYADNLEQLQHGTIWADTGFNGLSHFYFPHGKKRGVGVFSDALQLAEAYERKASLLAEADRHDHARFYVGALLHLVQDATIPHHATLKLLKGHYGFEQYVRKRYGESNRGLAKSGAIAFDELREYIQFAAKMALKALRVYGNARGNHTYSLVARCVLPIAERLTAGYLLHFYETRVVGVFRQSRVTGNITTMNRKLYVRYVH